MADLAQPTIAMMTQAEMLRWYVVHLRMRSHATVENTLIQLGYQIFAPKYCPAQPRRRSKALEAPLFPGYIFCSLDPQYQLPVLMVPGVIGILGTRYSPTPVLPQEIDAIQRTVAVGLPFKPIQDLCPGDRVLVENGPLRGVEGVVANYKSPWTLIVTVTLLNRSVAIELDSSTVVKLQSAAELTKAHVWQNRTERSRYQSVA